MKKHKAKHERSPLPTPWAVRRLLTVQRRENKRLKTELATLRANLAVKLYRASTPL